MKLVLPHFHGKESLKFVMCSCCGYCRHYIFRSSFQNLSYSTRGLSLFRWKRVQGPSTKKKKKTKGPGSMTKGRDLWTYCKSHRHVTWLTFGFQWTACPFWNTETSPFFYHAQKTSLDTQDFSNDRLYIFFQNY